MAWGIQWGIVRRPQATRLRAAIYLQGWLPQNGCKAVSGVDITNEIDVKTFFQLRNLFSRYPYATLKDYALYAVGIKSKVSFIQGISLPPIVMVFQEFYCILHPKYKETRIIQTRREGEAIST
jgi:hypothetical protein